MRVELQERSARPYVWLDVSYNGKYPPTELFADLAMVGWGPPAPAPPPRSAIDWSTPNEATGDPFSILDYFIDDVVSAPPGTGDRGRWTAGERVAYLKGLEGVLRRHDLSSAPVEALPPPPAAAASAVATGQVPAPSASASGTASTAPPRPRSDVAPASAGLPADASSGTDGSRLVHVEAMLVAGSRQTAIEALTSLDLPAKVETRERTKTVQFRGSTSTTTEMGQVLVTVVPASEVHRVTAILVNANAVMNEDAFTVGSLRADTLNSFLSSAEPAERTAPAAAPEVEARRDEPEVTIVVAATMFEYLAEVIVERGGRIEEHAPTQKIKRMHHRGSTREQAVPGVRAVIAVPLADLDALMVELAKNGLTIDDPDEVSVALPPPPPTPEPAAPVARTPAPAPVPTMEPPPPPVPPDAHHGRETPSGPQLDGRAPADAVSATRITMG